MRFGIIGLGRMGANTGFHAREKGHEVLGYDPVEASRQIASNGGIRTVSGLSELTAELTPPRVVVLYVPHGDATQQVCDTLLPLLTAGDIVLDGGNSKWTDSIRRHAAFAATGVRFLDAGTSGGVSGARTGACFMVGGDRAAYDVVEPLLCDLAVDRAGCHFVGPPGAGHMVKLIHNAIEFGMVQAIAEGVELLLRSGYSLDLPALLDTWQHGSVIRSWLVQLMADALREEPNLAPLSTYVEDTGEVKWVLEWAMEQDIPTPVASLAQTMLMQYRDSDTPTAKAVALLRHGYGGHPVHRRDTDVDPPHS